MPPSYVSCDRCKLYCFCFIFPILPSPSFFVFCRQRVCCVQFLPFPRRSCVCVYNARAPPRMCCCCVVCCGCLVPRVQPSQLFCLLCFIVCVLVLLPPTRVITAKHPCPPVRCHTLKHCACVCVCARISLLPTLLALSVSLWKFGSGCLVAFSPRAACVTPHHQLAMMRCFISCVVPAQCMYRGMPCFIFIYTVIVVHFVVAIGLS